MTFEDGEIVVLIEHYYDKDNWLYNFARVVSNQQDSDATMRVYWFDGQGVREERKEAFGHASATDIARLRLEEFI